MTSQHPPDSPPPWGLPDDGIATLTLDQADKARGKSLGLILFLAFLCPFIAWLKWRGSFRAGEVLSLTYGLVMVLYWLGGCLRLLHIRLAPRQWHCRRGCVVFTPAPAPGLLHVLCLLTAVTGCLASACMAARAATAPSLEPSMPAVLITLAVAMTAMAGLGVLDLASYPFPPPGRPAITLTPQGVWLWPRTRRRRWIAWEDQPSLTRVLQAGGAALITLSTRSPVLFTMPHLPLGYNQLGRVLALFTTHPELRPALAYPEGLTLVQALMHTPVHQIEERLTGGTQ